MTTHKLLVLDVDGVVSPVHPVEEKLAWRDEVEAGNVFGPVLVSPTLCTRLDRLAGQPDLTCAWLTSWTPDMRAQMTPFPGRTWPDIGERYRQAADEGGARGTGWWKWAALLRWLDGHRSIRRLAWCDDDLTDVHLLDTRTCDESALADPGLKAQPYGLAVIKAELAHRRIDPLLLAPQVAVGITRDQMEQLEHFLSST